MNSPLTQAASPAARLRFALYTSSLGNYFFHEIRDLIGAGLEELGYATEFRDERGGFTKDADWHIVIAPHEFFELGAGRNLVGQKWPAQLILFNTEQPSTYWLKLSAKHFDRAAAIWDINFESSLRICKSGYRCKYLPLGHVSKSPMLQEVKNLPLHAETRRLAAEIREQSGFHQSFSDRPIDLLFLGHASPRREQYFARYADQLNRLNCFFHKPAATRPMIPGQTTSMNTLTSVGLAQRSKILLNIHHGVDRYFEWHRIVLLGIAQRTLVITEPCTFAPPFQAGVDFVEAPLDELPDRVDYYVRSEAGQEEAQRIVDGGFETLTKRCRLADVLRPLVEGLAVPAADPGHYFPICTVHSASEQPSSICVVTPDVTGEGPYAGGGASQVALADTLTKAGHKVTLLHTEAHFGEPAALSHWLKHFAERGIEYVSLPSDAQIPLDASEACARSYETYLWLRRQSFQAVHFPDTHGIGFYSLLGKRQALAFESTRFCLQAHGPLAWWRQAGKEFVTNPYELELDFMERECFRLADAMTTGSDFMLRWLEEQKWELPCERLLRPDPISIGTGASATASRRVRELVYIGPLNQCHSLALFCDSLDRLGRVDVGSVSVTFAANAGSPMSQKAALYLQQRARNWSFSWRVSIVNSAVGYVQGDGRLAVIPSVMENSASLLRQFLALGIPFVSVNDGGLSELIERADHANALFNGSAKELAATLQKVIAEGATSARPASGISERIQRWLKWQQEWTSQAPPVPVEGAAKASNSTPLVSVCLVHFNRPELLMQSLASLHAQDYPNFEVVLVDDGSTKPEALEFLANLEPEFKQRNWQIIRQENRYLGAARNAGARHARGEYLVFMDDDNFAKPNELSTFIRAALKTGAEILTCAMDLFTGAEPPSPARKPKVRWIFLGGAAATGAIRNCFGDANCCIRRDTFLKIGGFTEDYGITHEDWEFYARAVLQGCRMETLPEALFWYRVADDSMIRSTPLYANLQRSLRPYLAAVPAQLQGLVHYIQGITCSQPEEILPVANYESLLRLHRRLLTVGQEMLRTGQTKAAESLFLEVLQSAETAGQPALLLQTLLDVGRAMAESDRREIAIKILENAVALARTASDPLALKDAQRLLSNAKGRGKFNGPKSGTEFVRKIAGVSPPKKEVANLNIIERAPANPVVRSDSDAPKANAKSSSDNESANHSEKPLVTIIIPTFNNLGLTRQCLETIFSNTRAGSYELMVVDNASTDGTPAFLREQEKAGRLKLISNVRNEGFARACNQGAQAANGPLALFLNNDTKVTSGWLDAMIGAARRPQVGIVGAKLLYADGRIQHAGIGFINGVPDHPNRHAQADAPEVNQSRELDMVTGACLLIRRELFLKLAGFDEAYRNGVEDIDLCLRARAAGFKVVYEPNAVVYHLEGQSVGRFNHVTENLQLFFNRWGKLFDAKKRFVVPKAPEIVSPSRSILLPNHQLPITVSWEGTFLDFGSLSHVNRELTRQLTNQSAIKLSRVCNQNPAAVSSASAFPGLTSALTSASPKDVQITVRHAWPPDWQRPTRGALVVIQPWEFGALPQEWVRQSARVTEFWVPSQCVRQMYIDSGVAADKVRVVPNGIDPEKFNPQAKAMQLATNKKFKFLFIGGTIHRKGPDLLLKGYLENFTAQDDVCLVIKDFGGQNVYAGQTFESQIRAAQAQPNSPEILYLNEELPPESLPGLYTACDCFVLPYRGEGFGLPVLEAMACGLPVITTAGGATDDFVRDEFGFRIPARRQVFGQEVSGMKLAGPGWMLEPDLEKLGERMRWVAAHLEEAWERGRLASEFARKEYTWEKSAGIAAQRIREIAAAVPDKTQLAKSTPRKAAPIVLPSCAKIAHLPEGRELLRQKKFQQSWEATLAALSRRPFHPEAYLLLAEISQAVGDGENARLCAEHARRLAPDWKPARQMLNQRLKGGSHPTWLQLPNALSSGHALRITHRAHRLSICLITKNEERFLGQCLASVKNIASQIVVVDTGSTDRTIEIAQEHGAEVHQFAWCDDFSAARNVALEHAIGDWVLMLDADEELSTDALEKLRAHLNEPKVIAWRLPIVDVGREGEGCSHVPRLFRNAPGLFYIGRVHEQVFSSIEVRREEWGLENRIGAAKLIHHGYTAEITRDRNKVERNLRLLELAIEELPGEPHLLMNLGLELSRSGREAEALDKYREAFEVLSSKPAKEIVPELRETLLTQFCTRLTAAKRFDEIVRILTSPMASAGEGLTASLHFSLGLAHMELGQLAEAATQMQQCLAKRNQPSLSPINKDIATAAPHHCLALCHGQLGDGAAAERAFEAGLKETGHTATLRLDYARFLLGQRRAVDALHRVHEVVAENSQNAAAWRFGGQIALSQPEFLEFACDWTSEGAGALPNDLVLVAQRAEALMLSQNTSAACELWKRVSDIDRQPRIIAALVLCELIAGNVTVSLQGDTEAAACSRSFIEWYRKLVGFRAQETIVQLNGKVGDLRSVLPDAARIIESVMSEAGRAEVAEVCTK